jgi:hypothetical protein
VHYTTIITISMFLFLFLKDLLAKFIISCTIKDQRATWLCLVEGKLTSLQILVSFQVEHVECSKVSSIAKENTIDSPSLELIQILALLQNKAIATKNMEMIHLGNATMHHLIARLLLEIVEKNHVRHIARGIDRLSPEPPWSPMLIEHRPGHLTQGSVLSFYHAILGRHIRT